MGGGSAWGALAGIESGFASIASSALWKHLRATNVVESPFASVRLRTRMPSTAGHGCTGSAVAGSCAAAVEDARWDSSSALIGRHATSRVPGR